MVRRRMIGIRHLGISSFDLRIRPELIVAAWSRAKSGLLLVEGMIGMKLHDREGFIKVSRIINNIEFKFYI